MEELLCIGCGAPIQTEDKEAVGFTPKVALEKGIETGELTANVVSVCVIITRSPMFIFQTMSFSTSFIRWEIPMLWWSMWWTFLTLMALSFLVSLVL